MQIINHRDDQSIRVCEGELIIAFTANLFTKAIKFELNIFYLELIFCNYLKLLF